MKSYNKTGPECERTFFIQRLQRWRDHHKYSYTNAYVMHCIMYEINQIRETVTGLTQLALSFASSTDESLAEE